jgi:hypothetical protein
MNFQVMKKIEQLLLLGIIFTSLALLLKSLDLIRPLSENEYHYKISIIILLPSIDGPQTKNVKPMIVQAIKNELM